MRNFIQPSEMPYTVGKTRPDGPPTVFDSGNYPSAFGAPWKDRLRALKPLQGKHQDGKYHGIGIGCFVKNTGQGPFEGARVVVSGADQIAVYLGITSLGQGHETTMAQICADTLGVPLETFTIFHGSTDMMPFGVGTFASRGTVMAGNAVYWPARSYPRRR